MIKPEQDKNETYTPEHSEMFYNTFKRTNKWINTKKSSFALKLEKERI